jgi:DNA-binding FadR family transcriptional regulator
MENVREASQQKAGEIISFILDRVSSGDWPTGHKIPTEKSLINQFSAARNTVRKALGKLENDGVILRQVGRGTFVRGDDDAPETDIAALIQGDASPAEINELRVILEPATAEIVVARATETEIRHAQKCLQNTLAAKTVEDYERWEAELHLTIINAAKNTILTRIYHAVHLARNKTEWKEIKRRSLNDLRRQQYENDHAAMVDAFARRDAVDLRQAIKSHLESVSHNMVNPVG